MRDSTRRFAMTESYQVAPGSPPKPQRFQLPIQLEEDL